MKKVRGNCFLEDCRTNNEITEVIFTKLYDTKEEIQICFPCLLALLEYMS